MAALTMTPATMRQPFASLDAPRMRSVIKTKMNVKNQQNGAAIAGKRRALGEIDTENIDPILNLSSKRKRGAEDDAVKGSPKPLKASRKALATFEPVVIPKAPSTPVKITTSTPKSTSALKPAGRSPQSKSACKPFARRSNIAKNRSEPAGNKKAVHRPFSIATALSNGKSKSQPASKAPASWNFEIHVDSEQDEMTNLMQHSTGVLDISDDESKVEVASRGKENVPPADLGLSLPASTQQESPAAAARKSAMMEESRSPLGELNASDYYGADLHAFSYEVVYDEDEENAPEQKKPSAPAMPRSTQPSRSSKLSSVSSISSILESTVPAKPADEPAKSGPSEAEIEIWESGSAADEQSEATSTSTEPLGL